ncbi:hybrid sensor histidine kinase/response regulator transcription factor [uncultured Parabacteroides sp.]|uniref:hybrid sensor histidine kinase/response regulator transcription factor n=1 Tax=uncultured Parabacteroides sp. TaxID=512312 RepID=UPI0025FADF96|nr:hybrid sensor histidine kinase/response regulator transcription factor [uncultured Parabacteroides sp.]
MRRYFIYLFLLCNITYIARGETLKYDYFNHLGIENGLSQLSVLDIFQDSDGYLWMGTRNGANQYDGYEFKVYRNEVNDSTTLSDSHILAITEDQAKNIWIGTTNGLNSIRYADKKVFRFYPNEVSQNQKIPCFLLHKKDSLLYTFSGNRLYLCQTDNTLTCRQTLNEIKGTVNAVSQAEDGTIYIGTTREGLFIYSANWEFIRHLNLPQLATDHTQQDIINTILAGPNGQVWIGTYIHGIYLYNSRTQQISHFDKENSNLSNPSVWKFAYLNQDSLLIGTFGGMNILDLKTKEIKPFTIFTGDNNEFEISSIHSLLTDKNQTLWVGTYTNGVYYHSPYQNNVTMIYPNNFSHLIIGKGETDKDGNIWFATEGAGLFFYNPVTQEQKLFPIKKPYGKENYNINIIKSIKIDGNTIYCSTHYGTVYTFDIAKETFTLLHDFSFNDINSLFIDSKKRLWIPTNSNKALVLVRNGQYINSFPTANGPQPFKQVSVIEEISPDIFLIGTSQDSLYLYDMQKGRRENLTYKLLHNGSHVRSGEITAILQDRHRQIWISTTKNGLFRLSHSLDVLKHYQKEDGIPDSYIAQFVEDENGDLWATTTRHIYKLDASKDIFTPIEHPYVMEFSKFASTASHNGQLYFPGNKGILALSLRQKKMNPYEPPVYITSVDINTQKTLLPPAFQNGFKTDYKHNNLTIRYTGINYIHPATNQYAYRLVGTDMDWHYVGNRREAYYSNLQPGTYTFEVIASNNDNLWNHRGASLQITITPPIYKTGWAYLLYFVLAASCITVIFRFFQQKQENEREIRYRRKEQKRTNELHQERMQMFTNFSHELRTPLTLIINPLNDLLERVSFSPEVKEALQLIKKNTGRMLLLVNNLMDIQKYEAEKSHLQATRFDFVPFIQEICHSFESVAGNRNIRFTLINKLPDSYSVFLDRTEIEKVFFNLLSNAFKFTPPEGEVSILIQTLSQQSCKDLPLFPARQSAVLVEANYLYIEVKDTGKGFDGKKAEKIFEPFYRSQEDIHQQIPGTGIGLSLTRSIVRQHNGCIWPKSSEQGGTTFMLLLPDTEKQETEITSGINREVTLLLAESEAKHKPMILLADDNQEILQYLEQQLSNEYVIAKAFNGKEALRLIEEVNPDIVVSDVMMPEMNGLELCRHIKEEQNLCHIPVILLTAKSMVSQIEEGLETGADDYMVKPFRISLLKARIKNILSSREKMKTIYGGTLSLKQFGLEEPEEDGDFLAQYIGIVKKHISDPDLDISVIYEALGMSRANFYRKVKAITGLSPNELIRNIRLEAGAKLLKESDMNISEIAEHVGFSSSSYFARSFKATYGISPTEYQKKQTK